MALSVAEPGRAGDRSDARSDRRCRGRLAAGPLLGARCRVRQLHHVFVFDPERGAGAAHRAVGGLRDHRQGDHPFHVRVLSDGDQHASGRQERRSQADRGRACFPRQRAPALDQYRSARSAAIHRHRVAACRRPRSDRHGAGRSLYRHFGHRLSDCAHRLDLSDQQNVRADCHARLAGCDIDGVGARAGTTSRAMDGVSGTD